MEDRNYTWLEVYSELKKGTSHLGSVEVSAEMGMMLNDDWYIYRMGNGIPIYRFRK